MYLNRFSAPGTAAGGFFAVLLDHGGRPSGLESGGVGEKAGASLKLLYW